MRSLARFLIPATAVASVALAPIGSTEASATTTPNLAAGQSAQWVTEAYTVPAAIPVDGDGIARCPGISATGSCGASSISISQLNKSFLSSLFRVLGFDASKQ